MRLTHRQVPIHPLSSGSFFKYFYIYSFILFLHPFLSFFFDPRHLYIFKVALIYYISLRLIMYGIAYHLLVYKSIDVAF